MISFSVRAVAYGAGIGNVIGVAIGGMCCTDDEKPIICDWPWSITGVQISLGCDKIKQCWLISAP